MPSSARGEGTTASLSGRSPAMSMVTLMYFMVHPATDNAVVD